MPERYEFDTEGTDYGEPSIGLTLFKIMEIIAGLMLLVVIFFSESVLAQIFAVGLLVKLVKYYIRHDGDTLMRRRVILEFYDDYLVFTEPRHEVSHKEYHSVRIKIPYKYISCVEYKRKYGVYYVYGYGEQEERFYNKDLVETKVIKTGDKPDTVLFRFYDRYALHINFMEIFNRRLGSVTHVQVV